MTPSRKGVLRWSIQETLRLIILLAVVALANSLLAMWISDSHILGFFADLHLDRDGIPIWRAFTLATYRSAPILILAMVFLLVGACFTGMLLQHRWWGWLKVPLVAMSAVPSFLIPFLAYLLIPSWRFQGFPDGGVLLPALCLCVGDCNLSSVAVRFRESMRLRGSAEHVTTLRSLGINPIWFLAPRALVDSISEIGGRISHLVGGLVALETMFNLRGLGVISYQAMEVAPADLHWLFWISAFCVLLRSLFRWIDGIVRRRWMPETLVESFDEHADVEVRADRKNSQLDDESHQQEVPSVADIDVFPLSPRNADRVSVSQSGGTSLHVKSSTPQSFATRIIRNLRYYLRFRSGHWVHAILAALLTGWFCVLVAGVWWYGDRPDSLALRSPDSENWFGTDIAGIDVLTAMRRGLAQMMVPVLAALISSTLFLPAALASLYRWIPIGFGRQIVWGLDRTFETIAEAIESLPKLIVLVAVFSVVDGGDVSWDFFGTSIAINTMTVRLFAVMGLLHSPQMYRAVRDEITQLNSPQVLDSIRLQRIALHEFFLRTLLKNRCWHVILIQVAVVGAGVLHFDGVLGFLGVRSRGVIYTWGANLGMGVESYMQYAALDWFNSWILGIPFLFLVSGIVALWMVSESLKTLMGGYVYRLR